MKNQNYIFLHTLVEVISLLLNSKMLPSQLKHISLFILAKHKHSNSCYYNYNPYKVSKQLGFSPTKWKNQINYYLEKGWCRISMSRSGGRNLVFNTLDQVLDGPLKGLRVRPDQWTAHDIHNQLLITILQNSEKQQKFVAKVKSDLYNPMNIRAHKKALRLSKTHGIELKQGEKADDRFKLSIFSLAKLFGCSTSTASRITDCLQAAGHLSKVPEFKNLGLCPSKILSKLEMPGVFYFKGFAYKREVNEYVLNYSSV